MRNEESAKYEVTVRSRLKAGDSQLTAGLGRSTRDLGVPSVFHLPGLAGGQSDSR